MPKESRNKKTNDQQERDRTDVVAIIQQRPALASRVGLLVSSHHIQPMAVDAT